MMTGMLTYKDQNVEYFSVLFRYSSANVSHMLTKTIAFNRFVRRIFEYCELLFIFDWQNVTRQKFIPFSPFHLFLRDVGKVMKIVKHKNLNSSTCI